MLIDSHCHIDFNVFTKDRKQVLERARIEGVQQIIVPSVSQTGWQTTIAVCSQYELHLALGLHPVLIDQHQPQHLNQLDQLCATSAPIAIGEIGLDYVTGRDEPTKQKQLAFFSKQLIIAKRRELPVIIHCRKAHDDCLNLLSETTVRGGIVHAFNGSIAQANKYLERGFLLGFGGMLTFDRSRKLRELLKALPLSAIALETDSPDMTVVQHRGERNSPEYLPYIAESVAKIKSISISEIAKVTSHNVRQVFNI